MDNIVTYTVTQVNSYIKKMLENDFILANIMVKGEISNFKNHSSGHFYFSLKDEECTIKCVMFRSTACTVKFVPENGMKVVVSGYVTAYPRDGQYQICCDSMISDGIGDLHIAYEKLKEKLNKEGLFDESHKRKLPLLPRRVAVVTSDTGAVIRDIINVSTRRYSKANIVLIPSAVQGPDAYKEIISAIDYINDKKLADVIIVGRGGGSIEDLWNFNREEVAYAIYNSKIPVVSAVGHETDFTIADFVADLRAPTPSAAAELVFPSEDELYYKLTVLRKRLKFGLTARLDMDKKRLNKLKSSYYLKRPLELINNLTIRHDNLNKRLLKISNDIIKENRLKLNNTVAKLGALSPLKTLIRGYSIATVNEKVIKSKEDIKVNEEFKLKLMDGEINAKRID